MLEKYFKKIVVTLLIVIVLINSYIAFFMQDLWDFSSAAAAYSESLIREQ